MEVVRCGFPSIIRDNDEIYFRHLVALIESVDELSSMEITKTPHSYHIRIAPSVARYIEPLLYEILKFNNLYGIHLELSKSMKASATISFNIEILE